MDRINPRVLAINVDATAHAKLKQILEHWADVYAWAGSADSVADGIEAVRPRLVVINVSVPSASGYEICRRIKSDVKIPGVPVVLLTTEGTIDHKAKYDAKADAYIKLGDADPVDTSNKLLQFLRDSGPVRAWTLPTRIAVDLCAHRAAAILEGEVALRSTGPVSEQKVTVLFGDFEFVRCVGLRLFRELPELIWIELTEQLIVERRCELTDLGKFEFSRGGTGRVFVNYVPASVVSQNVLPLLDFGTAFAGSDIRLAISRACRQELISRFGQFGDAAWGAGKAEEILAHATGPLLREFASDPEMTSAFSSVSVWPRTGRRRDFLGQLGLAAAHAAYYTFIVNFSRLLHSGIAVSVETVGVFRYEGRVEFAPSEAFCRLLAANVPHWRVAGV